MDRVATVGVIDPDHEQPTACRRSSDHLMRLALGHLGLNALDIPKRFFDLVNRDVSFRMV